jgi:pyrroloquinoline quinone (PQQ) biosynthesis protein C
MSFFIRLIEATDVNRRELESIQKVQDMLNGKMSETAYKEFLMDLYPIVWHFCPIMAAAASRCSDKFLPVRLHLYYNINEEKGHEIMVLNDLRHFGVDAETVISASPSYAVQAMIGNNYHMAERVHPCSILGMLYVLEFISSVYGGQVSASVAQGLGMPLADGFSFLESHASMDLDHMANLQELLEKIDDTDVQEIIINAIQMNFYLFTQMMRI